MPRLSKPRKILKSYPGLHTFARILIEEMTDRRLGQGSLAACLHISKGKVNDWCNARDLPSADEMTSLEERIPSRGLREIWDAYPTWLAKYREERRAKRKYLRCPCCGVLISRRTGKRVEEQKAS